MSDNQIEPGSSAGPPAPHPGSAPYPGPGPYQGSAPYPGSEPYQGPAPYPGPEPYPGPAPFQSPGPYPGLEPGAPVRPRRWKRAIALTTLSLLGLGALGGGATALALELTRKPTAAEVDAAGVQELASRWRIRTAGEIFPPTVEYSLTPPDEGGHKDEVLRARRVGISTSTRCADALDKEPAAILAKHGCRALLRATYVDASGTLVATFGVAVLPTSDQASGAESDFGSLDKNTSGVRAVGFPGTVTERFGDAQRQELWLANNSTPYVFLRATGWTDGRTTMTERERAEEFDFADAVTDKVIATFVRTTEPCKARGVRC